jgi:hypothetical protein
MVCVNVAECGRVYIDEGGFMNLEGSFVVMLIPALVSLSMHLFMAFLSTEDVFNRQGRREPSWWGILCWTKYRKTCYKYLDQIIQNSMYI